MNMDRLSTTMEVKFAGAVGEFEGYASIFNNVDQGGDIVLPGAFADCLKRQKRALPLLWQHDAANPIGLCSSLQEDEKGLRLSGQLLVEDDPLARRAHAHLKAGSISGLSIGYRVIPGGTDMDTARNVRLLKKLDLVEVSVVTMPMNDRARVSRIKSLIEGGVLPSLSEFENFLREAGFSKSQATCIAGHGLKALQRGEPATESSPAADFMAALAARLHSH
jgi:uncharacterized protein